MLLFAVRVGDGLTVADCEASRAISAVRRWPDGHAHHMDPVVVHLHTRRRLRGALFPFPQPRSDPTGNIDDPYRTSISCELSFIRAANANSRKSRSCPVHPFGRSHFTDGCHPCPSCLLNPHEAP